MPSKIRLNRISDRIQKELSEMLVTGKINDPRVESAYITDVTVDRELYVAKIYISALAGSEAKQEILQGFQHAAGYLRSVLSKIIPLRTFPELRFIWDETPERAERIEELLDSLKQEYEDNE